MIKLPDFFKQTRLNIGLLLLLLVLLMATNFVNPPLFLSQKLTQAKINVANFWQGFNAKKSSASITTSGQKLKIQFNLTTQDQQAAKQLSQNLGVGNDWTQGIEIGLDQQSLNKISQYLPADLEIKFQPNQMTFSSRTVNLLVSALPKNSFQIATNSASLTFKEYSDRQFNLSVDKPTVIVDYATASSKLRLSPQVQQWLPNFKKVARIELEINGKSMKGLIKSY